MSEIGPSDRVVSFVQAMNKWELDSWAAMRRARDTPDPFSYSDESAHALATIVREFCVSAQTKLQGVTPFGRPPKYDPSTERVVVERREPSGDALVETLRTGSGSVLYAGRYRYRLREEDGRWRIAALEMQEGGHWLEVPLPMLAYTRRM
jgi:hypothetical protein